MPRRGERFYSGRDDNRATPANRKAIKPDRGKEMDVRLTMYTGTFGQRVIRATHPLIVVAGERVLGSFSTLEAAERFIARQGSYSALILRHHGQSWVMAEDRPIPPLRHGSRSGLGRENGFQALGLRDAPLISRLQESLQNYPHITYQAGMHYLEIPAQTRNGFRVWFRERAGRYTIGFEKWHEEFTNAASAFNFFVFGLSRACRLKVLSCGGVDYKWQVQRRLDRRWVAVSESGMAFFPFWRKKMERFLQNDIIKPP